MTLAAALRYHALGLAPMALAPASKRPRPGMRWRQLVTRPPTEPEVVAMFSNGPANLAILTGAPSGGLLVLDCDTGPKLAEVTGRLAGLGITTPVVQRPANGSDHDHGGHVYLRCPVAVRSFRLPDLDGKAAGGYVVSPPSRHPAGGEYHFVVGLDDCPIFTLPDLDTLGDWLPLKPWEPAPPVPRSAWRLLRGDAQARARYTSRSEAEAAICAALIRSGHNFSECLRLFMAHQHPGKFAELHAEDPQNAQRYLALTWHRVSEYLEAHPSEAPILAQELRARALSRPWPGRSGPSDRAVYLAHCDIVERCGRQPHGASCRELAEMAGLSWQTANKANSRLVEACLLKLADKAVGTLAKRFYLVPDPALQEGPTPTDGTPPPPTEMDKLCHSITPTVTECHLLSKSVGQGAVGDLGHDLWRWSALGKSGAEVWAILAQGEVHEKDLVKATGRCRRTIKRRLMDMFRLGLAEPLGCGLWAPIEGADLDQAAQLAGAAGKGARQRAQHKEERSLHRMALEQGRRRKKKKGGYG